MLDVGLTGGIGSGKSTVAAELRRLGALVIDADAVAREVVEPGRPTLAAIVHHFGPEMLQEDGSLDRSRLAQHVFPDPAALADLNAITTPAISARVAELRAEAPADAVTVFDMPLLVERRLWPREHLTLVVDADVDTRVSRLVQDRGLDRADARNRIQAQATDQERRAAADVWVDNNGEVEATLGQVRRVWTQRLVPYNDNLVAQRLASREVLPRLVEPDPTWPAQAARLAARLEDALGDRAVGVEHVGSTSIPGLVAKDVLDLLVGVRRLAEADDPAFVEDLSRRGFIRVEAIGADNAHTSAAGTDAVWPKRFHANADPGRAANVHVREIGSPGWDFALQFRDWLRADGAAREEYAAEKRRLLAVATSTSDYAAAKEPWFAQAYPRVVGWAERTGWVPSTKPGRASGR